MVSIPVAPAAPALFTANSSGTGPGAILNQTGSLNTPENPADKGSIIVLYLTGEGLTTPAGIDGKIATDALPKPVLPLTVSIGGIEAEILYSGAAPASVAGLAQVNARIPAGAPAGAAVPVTVRVGDTDSRTAVTLAIR